LFVSDLRSFTLFMLLQIYESQTIVHYETKKVINVDMS